MSNKWLSNVLDLSIEIGFKPEIRLEYEIEFKQDNTIDLIIFMIN